MTTSFEPGTVVVFDPESFDEEYWSALSEDQKLTYFGKLGYGSDEPVQFIFLCEIRQAPGHCVLLPMAGGTPVTMMHTDNFKKVPIEEVR